MTEPSNASLGFAIAAATLLLVLALWYVAKTQELREEDDVKQMTFGKGKSRPPKLKVDPSRVLIEVVGSKAKGTWSLRASGFPTQATAEAHARELGRAIEDSAGNAELVVKDRSGRIRRKDSYGADDRKVPG